MLNAPFFLQFCLSEWGKSSRKREKKFSTWSDLRFFIFYTSCSLACGFWLNNVATPCQFNYRNLMTLSKECSVWSIQFSASGLAFWSPPYDWQLISAVAITLNAIKKKKSANSEQTMPDQPKSDFPGRRVRPRRSVASSLICSIKTDYNYWPHITPLPTNQCSRVLLR